MCGISGIKYQKKLEKLPFFNKKTAQVLIDKRGDNLDKKIQRLLNKKYLINLKKGLYVSKVYLNKIDNINNYSEYIANQLRKPSYLSLDYMLSKYNLIPEIINVWTSITKKSTRKYENYLGNFVYKNVKEELFCGCKKIKVGNYEIYRADKSKAMFDFLYLKSNLSNDLKNELEKGLRLNWNVFSEKDIKNFEKYAQKADSKKMSRILSIIKEIKNVN